MATSIKGITVEIGGNTTGLNKALASTNKEIKNTQSDLKEVEKLLKLDPTNTELLAQKQRLLGQAVGETSAKLETLKTAAEQAQAQLEKGEITQDQYDALTREIKKTENELENLEKAAASSNTTLSKISATADQVASATKKAADATRGLSTAAAGGLVALGGLAVKAGQTADDLNTLSKQSGFSTDEIQKWQYAADIVDVSTDDIITSAKKLKKNMTSTSSSVAEAFERLGVSTTDASGELRDSNDVFYETLEALSQVTNETERDTLAMELFGRNADSLAGIIDDGGAALRSLGEEAEAAGVILSQDTLNSANEFNDSIDRLKATASGSFMQMGAEIAEDLIPVMEDLTTVLGDVLSVISSLSTGQIEAIAIIALVVASISPLLSLINNISTAISFLSSTVIPACSSAFSFLAANPIVLVIAGIVALVAAIGLFGDQALEIFGKVDDFLQNVFATDFTKIFGPILGEALNAFFASVKNIWDGIKKIFTGIIDFVRGVFTGDWRRAWEGIKSIFSGVFNSLTAIAKVPLNGIIGLLNMAINAVNQMIAGFNSIGIDLPPYLGGGSWHPNIPSIPNIAYLAKGGILNEGSAIVGENGPEFLTMDQGRAIVQPLSGGGSSDLSGLMGLLGEYLPYLATAGSVTLDTGTLVGSIAPDMNDALGRIASRESRR